MPIFGNKKSSMNLNLISLSLFNILIGQRKKSQKIFRSNKKACKSVSFFSMIFYKFASTNNTSEKLEVSHYLAIDRRFIGYIL